MRIHSYRDRPPHADVPIPPACAVGWGRKNGSKGVPQSPKGPKGGSKTGPRPGPKPKGK